MLIPFDSEGSDDDTEQQAELRILNAVGRGPGALHALRRLLGRAWMVAQAAGRDAIKAGDIAAADEGVAADEYAPTELAV